MIGGGAASEDRTGGGGGAAVGRATRIGTPFGSPGTAQHDEEGEVRPQASYGAHAAAAVATAAVATAAVATAAAAVATAAVATAAAAVATAAVATAAVATAAVATAATAAAAAAAAAAWLVVTGVMTRVCGGGRGLWWWNLRLKAFHRVEPRVAWRAADDGLIIVGPARHHGADFLRARHRVARPPT
jgi:hypothetical protein